MLHPKARHIKKQMLQSARSLHLETQPEVSETIWKCHPRHFRGLVLLSVPKSGQIDNLDFPDQITRARVVIGARGSFGIHPQGPATKKSLKATMVIHQVSKEQHRKVLKYVVMTKELRNTINIL